MRNDNLEVLIDGRQLDVNPAEVTVAISYRLEDPEDFTKKTSSEAFSVVGKATSNNDQVSNTLHNPGIEDMTAGQVFRNYRRGVIKAAGQELLVGKAFLVNGKHTDRPTSYQYDFYGNNGDWSIDLKEATLYDFIKHINFVLSERNIMNSWVFDGRDESLPYVFAPVRYRQEMDFYDETVVDGNYTDEYMTPLYLKPSLSKYWIIYWAFKSLGYRISSEFFNTEYFRRQVMPWTWGNFLTAEGNRQDNLRFLVKGTEKVQTPNNFDGFVDVKATNTSSNGGFDANGVYTYTQALGDMKWTYLPQFNYQLLEATFNIQIDWEVLLGTNSEIHVRLQWYKNGVMAGDPHDIIHQNTGPQFGFSKRDIYDEYITFSVNAGDNISLRVYVKGQGNAWAKLEILQFTLTDFRIPLGGTIDFANYNGFKKHKFLDFLAGVIGEFNLSINTDSVSKVVFIEPTHAYSLTDDMSKPTGGYFNQDFIRWDGKQDLRQESTIALYSDYEREVTIKYKDDGNDGILKVVQDRNVTTLAAGKYVFPERFKSDKKEIENRFFSPTMHYDVSQWQNITGVRPQMICIVPENVSNTSNDEAQNTFQPKSAYYKGNIAGVGGWRLKVGGVVQEFQTFPFMFAVNYQVGGENDPILSYSDEVIAGKVGKGLLRRFYLQRFAILRNGQFYTTYFNLNNLDVTNWLHREYIVCRGQRWELVEIKDYTPTVPQSTECFLRRWVPVSKEDSDAVFPSAASLVNGNITANKFDIKYNPLKCLVSDIPGPITQ